MNKWTLKKICCYMIYRLIARRLPVPGEFGLLGRWCQQFRTLICRPLFMDSAKVVSIGKGVDFDNGSYIIMKDHANIGSYALLQASSRGTITLGRHVMMGMYCIIFTQNHKYLEEGFDGFQGKDVTVDDFAWIGHRVTILPGARIGKHAIVGAGAVVTKDVPDYAIVAGNPAVVKKYRKKIK